MNKLKLEIDFKGGEHVFVKTPTEEQFEYLYNKLINLGGTPKSKHSGSSKDYLDKLLYVTNNSESAVGGYDIHGYNNSYQACELYDFEEFTRMYGIEPYSIDQALAEVEQSIEKMEARLSI